MLAGHEVIVADNMFTGIFYHNFFKEYFRESYYG